MGLVDSLLESLACPKISKFLYESKSVKAYSFSDKLKTQKVSELVPVIFYRVQGYE